MTQPARILYCHCAYAKVIPQEVKEQVLKQLSESGVPFESVPDLCEMSAQHDPALQALAQGANVRIAACYPRAVRWLFAAAGAPLPTEGVEVLNMRVTTAEQVVQGLLAASPAPPETSPAMSEASL